jgi:hypothetical protein
MSESIVPALLRQSTAPSFEGAFVASFVREAERKRAAQRLSAPRCEWVLEHGRPRCRWA